MKGKFLSVAFILFIIFTGCSDMSHRGMVYDRETHKWVYVEEEALSPEEAMEEERRIEAERVKELERLRELSIPAEAGAYRIGPNDILTVVIYKYPELTRSVTVRDDGSIFLPLAGPVKVAGFTISEAQARITDAFAKVIQNPQISVEIEKYQSRRFYVLGAVMKPGVYPLDRPTTVVQALSIAGGIAESAKLSEAYMLRENRVVPVNFQRLLEEGDVRYNIYLSDNDVIYIPSAIDQKVFVLGDVRNPGVVPIVMGRLTLAEAIARCGGFALGARWDNLRIIRGGLRNPKLIRVNFERALDGDVAYNFLLKSGDIVFVSDTVLGKWNKILQQLLPTLSAILTGGTVAQISR